MKRLLLAGAFAISVSFACNLTVGECYPVGQNPGSPGAGASISGGGTGALGDSQPLGYMSQADCNDSSQKSGPTLVGAPPGSSGTSAGAGGGDAVPPLPLCDLDGGAGSAANPCLLPPLPLCDSDGGADAAANPCIQPPENPCYAKCDADYEKAAVACGRIADAALRKTCQDNAYANYKSCRQNCASAQKTCLDMFEDCDSRNYNPCNRVISFKSLCAYCQDDCNAGEPYNYKQCTQCGFK